jgi:hypothetical protein
MNIKPDFLTVGALVKVGGFVGMIAEIAESETSIMVKVESAKSVRRFQKPDWLNYTDAPYLWAPATWEDFLADAEGEKQAAIKSVEAIDQYVESIIERKSAHRLIEAQKLPQNILAAG